MKKTHHTTEQIIRILREAETSGQSHEELCRQHNISSQTFYRWKSKFGGMSLTEAQSCLGWTYLNTAVEKNSFTNLEGKLTGEVFENYSLGTNWLIKAALLGEPNAEGKSGDLFSEGCGVIKDSTLGARWYERAVRHGNPMAMLSLANLYRTGDGVPMDGNKAFQLFYDAAIRLKKDYNPEKSDLDNGRVILKLSCAELPLGEMARDGEGVPQDLVEAYAWFNLAAAKGNIYSQRERDKIGKTLSPKQIAEAQSRSSNFLNDEYVSYSGKANSSESSNVLQVTGTGFFITENGYLISNYHVVNGAKKNSSGD